ncbi:MAG: hypothetical protein E8D45_07195 [Nitrospira sp.]|nr:MAG: hypothetical protein E8D45_07195 [Nitrospira sp.]
MTPRSQRQSASRKPNAPRVVFLLDVDNTLLDNDRVAADLRCHLERAVGAPAFVPPIPGRDRPGVHVCRTIADSDAIIAQAKPGRRAVIIGEGLLGLEAAGGLINYGVTVTVVHLMDRLMEQQLDAIGGAMLKREIECWGLEVRLNATTTDILGNGNGRVAVAGSMGGGVHTVGLASWHRPAHFRLSQ